MIQITYKEEHLGLQHHGNGSRWGNGRSAGWDGQTKLHIPIQLGRLVWELEENDKPIRGYLWGRIKKKKKDIYILETYSSGFTDKV